MTDTFYMQMSLDLAAKGRGKTSPNPMVGAVIVKGDKIIGRGYHKRAGTAHAEIAALRSAGPEARGAALYVNLEPCCHTDKRTPPCTKAIIQSGIKKVVTAMIDPNPLVAGNGLKVLRKAGIKTTSGVMKKEALKLNEAFIWHVTKKVPFVVLKIAQSLDGKIATARGESKWITGLKARKRVHELRNELDAVLVGSGTVKEDNPSLDCRLRGGRNPYRVIVDSRLQIPLNAKVLKYTDSRTIIATTVKAGRRKITAIEKTGHRVLVIKDKSGKVNLKHLMKELGRRDIMSILIEGGSSISASALSDRLVNKIMFFVAPKIIGGTNSIASVGGTSPALLKNAFQLKNFQASDFGEDILIEGYMS
jgi:diaminohydroxyphosphoribosylaminopyrimidine deaminase/5-amino-6-(5-phosphoribosylamino)uracil reductase